MVRRKEGGVGGGGGEGGREFPVLQCSISQVVLNYVLLPCWWRLISGYF